MTAWNKIKSFLGCSGRNSFLLKWAEEFYPNITLEEAVFILFDFEEEKVIEIINDLEKQYIKYLNGEDYIKF